VGNPWGKCGKSWENKGKTYENHRKITGTYGES